MISKRVLCVSQLCLVIWERAANGIPNPKGQVQISALWHGRDSAAAEWAVGLETVF